MSDKWEELGPSGGRKGRPEHKEGDEPGGLIRLTGLWKSKSGKSISGLLSRTSRLLILPNERKQKDSDPDYIAFLARPAAEGQDKDSDQHPF